MIQKKIKRVYLIAAMCLACTACQITDKKPQVALKRPINEPIVDLVIINGSEYYGDLVGPFAAHGYNIKPISSRAEILERESADRLAFYKEVGTQYVLSLDVVHYYGIQCVFSDHHKVDVTMMLIDCVTNNTLLVIKQSGPTGPCPPLTPVWDLLADEFKKSLSN